MTAQFSVSPTEFNAALDLVASADEAPFDVSKEADGSGGSIVRADLQDLLDLYAGVRPLLFRAGKTFATDGRVTIPSNTHMIFEPGARLLQRGTDTATGTSTLWAGGTEGAKVALTANIAAFSSVVTLPTGQVAAQGFVRGDLIGFVCDTTWASGPLGTGGANVVTREFRRITKVSGDTVYLDVMLDGAYTTAANAKFWKITPCTGLVIDGLHITADRAQVTPGTDKTTALQLRRTLGAVLRNVKIEDALGGCFVYDSYDTEINGLRVDGLESFSDAYGYGLNLQGSTSITVVNGLRGSRNRHLFSTTAHLDTGVYSGGPMFATVNGGVALCDSESYAPWDTHEAGRHIEFNGCQAFGAGVSSHFQMRAKHVHLNNCFSWGATVSAVTQEPYADELQVNGGEFLRGQGTAGAIKMAGTGGVVKGATVRGNTLGPGVSWATTAVNPEVSGCTIIDNKYGIQDLGCTGGRSVNNRIPQSATQTVALLNGGATIQIHGGSAMGYGSTTSPFSGLSASAIVSGVATDGGVIGNLALALGAPGVVPGFDTLLFRNAFKQGRTDAFMRGYGVTLAQDFNTAGLTSAQIDAAISSAVGVAAADGMTIRDATNQLLLTRLAGKWNKTATLTQIA